MIKTNRSVDSLGKAYNSALIDRKLKILLVAPQAKKGGDTIKDGKIEIV